MAQKYFVTGTDTGVGKTYASCALLRAAQKAGKSTLGLKPVAAGCEEVNGRLENEDAQALMAAMSVSLSYEQVNPVALPAATSPHIAAAEASRQVSVSRLLGFVRGAMMSRPDFAIVEGAGGWRVPLNHRETLADLAKQLEYPVILVVGMKLGCINHALLTAEAVMRDGLQLVGWIANQPDPGKMDYYEEYLESLKQRLPGVFLGALEHDNDGTLGSNINHLDLSRLDL